jgi:predicted nucleic acid-binding protein
MAPPRRPPLRRRVGLVRRTRYVRLVRPERILNARSDDLARVQEHVARHPEIRPFAVRFEHLPLVIDTNRALQDVAWLAKRKNPDARTSLQELCASGFVSLYAPDQLREEVERRLTCIAENVKVPRDRVEEAWASYVTLINVIPTEHLDIAEADSQTRDPSDLPFLAAQQAVGAHGMLSKDKDLPAMGALVVKHEVLRIAVEFARSKSMVVQGTVLGTGTLGLGAALTYGAFKGVLAMVSGYRRLPGWLQVLLPVVTVGATAFVVFHAPTRARVRDLVRRAKPWLAEVRERGGDLLDQYLEEMHEADGKAKAALALLREQVPIPARRPTLKQLAYRICLASRAPLSLGQIENRVRLQGYHSKSKDLQPYLRAVLRRDPRLVLTDGGWKPTRRAARSGPIIELRREHVTSTS